MNLLLENQNYIPQSINAMNSVERHKLTEMTMINRIKLTYEEGIKWVHQIIYENEEIRNAYENFLKNKFKTIPQCLALNILIYSGLDKFKNEIIFIIKNSANDHSNIKASLFLFKIDSSSPTTFSFKKNLFLDPRYYIEAYFPFVSDNRLIASNVSEQEALHFRFNCQLNILYYSHVLDAWNRAFMITTIENRNRNQDAIEIANQLFLNEDRFRRITTYFHSILSSDDLDETNFLDSNNKFHSTFNPGHTTLLPDDIENFQNLSIKNARNKIE